MKKYVCLLMAIITLLLAGACAPATPDVLDLTPSLSPTPVPTVMTTSAKTTVPTPTTTPALTAAPTPMPETLPEGSVVIADGFYYTKLTDEIKQFITGLSYPKDDVDCLISYDDLRYIKLLHYDFEGNVKEGELIVNSALADEVTEIFYLLYMEKYPLTSVKLVDSYGECADDNLSMAANNTSAFNYRYVSGSKKLSLHSFGTAIDINPMLNPYVKDGSVSPENGAAYADRSLDFTGKIDENDYCYKLFTERGWSWGGHFKTSKDYQHFSKDLGYQR